MIQETPSFGEMAVIPPFYQSPGVAPRYRPPYFFTAANVLSLRADELFVD
jgi:hypothetical protein